MSSVDLECRATVKCAQFVLRPPDFHIIFILTLDTMAHDANSPSPTAPSSQTPDSPAAASQ